MLSAQRSSTATTQWERRRSVRLSRRGAAGSLPVRVLTCSSSDWYEIKGIDGGLVPNCRLTLGSGTHPNGRKDAQGLVVAPLAVEVSHEGQQPCRLGPRQFRRRLPVYVCVMAAAALCDPSMRWEAATVRDGGCNSINVVWRLQPYVMRRPARRAVVRSGALLAPRRDRAHLPARHIVERAPLP